MRHPLRNQLLASFRNARFTEHIAMEYSAGNSGADVFAARFERKDTRKENGLEGTFVIKIEKEEDAKRIQALQADSDAWKELFTPLYDTSHPVEGFVATAYKVAFQSFVNTSSLASVLDKRSSLSVEQTVRQIESLCETFVNLHLKIDKVYRTDHSDENAENVFYHLLEVMLEKRRLFDIQENGVYKYLSDWPSNPNTTRIMFEHKILPNPIWYTQLAVWEALEKRKPYMPSYYVSRIHGDLHTENIICASPEAEKSVCPEVIDAGQTRDNGIPFFDLAYLEFDIIRRFLPAHKKGNQAQWFRIFEHIMDDISPDKELRRKPGDNTNWDVDTALTFIFPMREQLKRLLGVLSEHDKALGESLEFVWWLATVAVGLNYARKGDTKERQQSKEERKAAMLYAAYGLKKLLERLELWDNKIVEPPPFVSWESRGAGTKAVPQYMCIPSRTERDELDVIRLLIDEDPVEHTRKWPLTSVFVWPDVRLQKLDPRYDVPRDVLSPSGNPISSTLIDVLAKEKKLLLFGDVGTGKSMILQYLLLQISSKNAEFAEKLPAIAGLFPIFIDLVHYAQVVHGNHKGDLPLTTPNPRLQDFIISSIHENYPEYKDSDFIEQQINDGKVLYLFYDLDAISDGTLQEKVARQIKEFTDFNSKQENRSIVTSRPIDFKGRELYSDSNYATYTLSTFIPAQIRSFLTQWLEVHCEQTDDVQKEVERLWQFICNDDMIRDMVTNPLFLTIYALRQSINHISPFRRNEYFEHCEKILLSQKSRKNDHDNHIPEKLDKIMYALAFWMCEQFTDKPVSRDDLVKHVEGVLTHEGIQQEDAVDTYIDFMRKEMGILIKSSKEQYDFLFMPLERYFMAKHIFYIFYENHAGKISQSEFIQRHWDSVHWRGVFRYMFGIMLSRLEEDYVKIYMHISFQDQGVPPHNLLFAAQILIDNPGLHPSIEEKIVLDTIISYLTHYSDELRAKFSQALKAWSETVLGEKLKSALHYESTSYDFYEHNSLDKKLIHEHLELVVLHTGQLMEPEAMIRRSRMMMLLCLSGVDSSHGETADWSATTIEQLNQSSSAEVKSTLTILLGMLADHDSSVRKRLLKALSAPEWQVRSAASYALSHLTKVFPDLPAILFSRLKECTSFEEADEEAEALINTFALIGSGVQAEVLAFLLEYFPDASSNIQRVSVLAVGKIVASASDSNVDYTKIQNFLLAALVSQYPFIRAATASALKDLGEKEKIRQDERIKRALLRALSDADSQVKEDVREALECFGKHILPPGDSLLN